MTGLRLLRAGRGYVSGFDYEYLEIVGGDHSIPSVRQRVPAFLAFFSRRTAGDAGRAGARRAQLAVRQR